MLGGWLLARADAIPSLTFSQFSERNLHCTRRSDGKRRAVALGPYPSIGLKEARRRAKQLQAEIEDEEKRADPAGRVKVRREAETFEELAQTWIERHGQPNNYWS